ncbi:MAG: hypothetical protein M3Q98_15675 [Actinomycetota bacterium]|nr:hypothetical protein [Actinomycetota bacterium]
MSRERLTRWLGVLLGSLFVIFGVLETIRLTRSGDGGLVFWFGTLVGGGALVFVGLFGLREHPHAAWAVLSIGALAGSVATAWTIIIPVFAVALIVLKANDMDSEPPAA